MQADDIRQTIAETLEDAEMDVSQARLDAFAATGKDIGMHELDLDSLARLDLLVALETEYDAIVSPEQFSKFWGLNELVGFVINPPAKADVPVTETSHTVTTAEPLHTAETPRIVLVFQRAFRFCHTVAQLNKLLSTVDSHCTPLDMAALETAHSNLALLPPNTPQKFHAAIDEWLARITQWLSFAGKTAPEPFIASNLAPTLRFFMGAESRDSKTLIIGFSGKNRRSLFIPNTVLLQHLDVRRHDVLIVAEPRGGGFRSGIPPFGNGVTDLVNHICAMPLISQYQDIRLLGTSAGAYASLLTGHALNANRVLAIGGRFAKERHVFQSIKMWFLMRHYFKHGQCQKTLFNYATDKRRDFRFARRMSKFCEGTLLGIADPSADIGHNILGHVLTYGRLGDYLKLALLSDDLINNDAQRLEMVLSADRDTLALSPA